MNVYHDFNGFKKEIKTILTIGTFDGVHVGHRKLINRLKEIADERGHQTAILTFEPHPRILLNKDLDKLKLLSTFSEKTILLEKCGIDNLFVMNFNANLAELEASDFVRDILVKQLNVSCVIIGYDHRFGKDRKGDVGFLKQCANTYGFDVEEIPEYIISQDKVSSTSIRNFLTNGKVEAANVLLGTNYTIHGKVVEGDKIGRTIGFPTANICVSDTFKLIPEDGIYAAKAWIDKTPFEGMLYIGNRPTVDGNKQSIEINLFDFDTNIYHKDIVIELFSFIRGDEYFNSLDELTAKIKEDEIKVRVYFEENRPL